MPAVGKYEILDPLGTGSMGTVYRARDTVLDRIVALKTIRTGIDVEPESRKRFYREARTCARLQHPNIVTIYDLGEEERTAFISMELLTGLDLRQVIQQRQNLTLAAKLQVMAQICDALAHAHREGVIHRDVKPSNLFLLTDRRAKVLDFGIARLPSSRLTMTGRVLGTPNYMSPEQIRGLRCDGRSDLFSAGVAFFEFLVHVHPFRSPLIPRRVVEGEPDSIFDHDSSMPILLEQVFERALAKDPERRYSTGDEFAADVRAVLDAIQMNSSPTFSRVELPSARSMVSAPPPKPPVLGEVLPGEDDPDELRMSEVLRLLPEFESVAERDDAVAARKSFVRLQSVAGDDPRFREALENCRSRIAAIEGGRASPASEGRPAGGVDPPTTPKHCPACQAANRKAAAFCIECGEPFPDAAPPPSPIDIEPTVFFGAEPVPNPSAPPNPLRPQAVSVPGGWGALKEKLTPLASRLVSGTWWKERFKAVTADQKRLAMVSAGLLVCVLLLTVVAETRRPGPHPEPAVAVAIVEPVDAKVLEVAGDQRRLITTLHRGDPVNVLQIPGSREQEWVRVQAKSGAKTLRPGYLRSDELREWAANAPKDELALIRMYKQGERGSDGEIRAQIDSLNRLASKVYGTRIQREAALDALNLELTLAQRAKERNEPPAVWMSKFETFPKQLAQLREDPALEGKVAAFEAREKDLMQVPLDPGPPPPPPPPPPRLLHEAAWYISHAEAAWSLRDWKRARSYVGLAIAAGASKSETDALTVRIREGEALER